MIYICCFFDLIFLRIKKRGVIYREKREREMDETEYYVIVSVMLYVMMSSTYMYKMLERVMGGVVKMARYDGCPTMMGVMVSGLIYGVMIYMMMNMEGVMREIKSWTMGKKEIEERVIPEVRVKEDE